VFEVLISAPHIAVVLFKLQTGWPFSATEYILHTQNIMYYAAILFADRECYFPADKSKHGGKRFLKSKGLIGDWRYISERQSLICDQTTVSIVRSCFI
jgi:hypothetical protein